MVSEQAHEMEENSKCPSRVLRVRPSACWPWPEKKKHMVPAFKARIAWAPAGRPRSEAARFCSSAFGCGGRSARPGGAGAAATVAPPATARARCLGLGDGGGSSRLGRTAARFYRSAPLFCPLPASQVLQGGGLESPTKPKGRPKKNSIPSSEQLSEQERARDAEKPPESLGSPAEVSQEE